MKKIFLLLIMLFLLSNTVAFAGQQKAIPVLMYHSVQDIPNNAAVISSKNFRQQMQFLANQGYKTLTLEQLYAFLTTKNYVLPAKAVVITFDDGYKDTYTTVLPILKKYGFKASLFLVANKINTKTFSLENLKSMEKGGLAIYSHTFSHLDLKTLSLGQQEREILLAEGALSKAGIKHAKYFCYPYSHFNNTTVKLLKKLGYKMAFSNSPGWVKPGDNLFALNRVYIGNGVSLADFKERMQKTNYALLK